MFELKRKLIHFVGLSVPIVYYFTSRETTLAFTGLAVVCALLVEAARLRWGKMNEAVFILVGGYTRDHEQKRVTGATYYAVAAFLAVAAFSREVAVVSLLFLTFGDSAAALVGTRYGVHKLFGKSLEGSLTCLCVCVVIGWTFLGWIGLLGAAVATFIELLLLPVDDNLRIPLVSGGIMQAVLLLTSGI